MNRRDENAPASYGLLRKLSRVTGLNTSKVILNAKKAKNLLEDSKIMDIEGDLRALGAFGTIKVNKPKGMSIKRNSVVVPIIDLGL